MKGIVLGYDAEAEAIVLRADNGRRYRFKAADWRERTSPRKSDPVDFEPEGDRARDVYLTGPSSTIETSAPAAPLSIVATWGPARFFLARPVLTCSILVLIACLTGAYAVGDARISIFGAPELIARMSEALDSLIAVSGTDPAPRLGAGLARILLVLLLGLYAVPILAALTLWREFVGRPDRRLARIAGIATIVLPIALPLIMIVVVQAWVLPGIPDVGTRLGRSGVTTPQQVFEVLRLYATGTVLLIAAGAALWAAGAGRLSQPLNRRTIDEPFEASAAPQVSAAYADTFAPSSARRRPAPPRPAAAEKPGLVPFLKLGSRRATPVAPPSQDPPEPPAYAGATGAPTATPLPQEAESDLPPRGGSVWPEPQTYRVEESEAPPEIEDTADQKR